MSCDHPDKRKTQIYTDLGLKCSENIIKFKVLDISRYYRHKMYSSIIVPTTYSLLSMI